MTTDTTAGLDPTRRSLLRILGLTGSAAVALLASARTAAAATPKHKARGVIVYRLSVRKRSRCRACSRHHRRFAFATHAIADANRAHPGCNCPIGTQRLRPHDFRVLFPKGGAGVGDLGRLARTEGLGRGTR
jgi:hypothetical protein